MSMKIKNRKGEYVGSMESQEACLRFLYKTIPGRVCLKVLTKPIVSKTVGCFMNSFLSTGMINSFVKKNDINLSEYQKCRYKSYNEFFTRKIKPERRPIVMEPDVFISPCDSKLTVYPIEENNVFFIKDSVYRLKDLVDGDPIYKEYEGGYCMIFRLTVDDYHRYCYVDNGTKEKNQFVSGELHTVNPIALGQYNIYKRNSREYTIMHTENFGDIVEIDVGAMMIGRIKNHHQEYTFRRGEEKGLFEFGGSTTVLLVKKDQIIVDEDLLTNTINDTETVVKMGEQIGIKSGK
ncbi:phosphatidylserine decarboxylase [Lachnospiraceae bacterium KM106-2]|nr:phosphatidylserine decarboxylase [Lachnospiraceae bacterium KM106-2]